jgi:hypothetical protein
MLESLGSITGEFDVVALEPQRTANGIPQRLVIVDHDYPGRHPEHLLISIAMALIEPHRHEPMLNKS